MSRDQRERNGIDVFVDIIWFPMRFFGAVYAIYFFASYLNSDYEQGANFINFIGPPMFSLVDNLLGWFVMPTIWYGIFVFIFWFFFYWLFTLHGLLSTILLVIYHIANSVYLAL